MGDGDANEGEEWGTRGTTGIKHVNKQRLPMSEIGRSFEKGSDEPSHEVGARYEYTFRA
jgi:hypothetical protein